MISSKVAQVTIILVLLVISVEKGLVNSLSSAGTVLTQTIKNLNSIVSHIQNPELYSPSWANQIEFHGTSNEIIAKCDTSGGELVTLYPIKYISIGKAKEGQISDQSLLSKRVDLLEKERYPYPHLRIGSEPLYIHSEKNVAHDGWYGNIIPSASNEQEDEQQSNCRFLPLPGVAPVCGMVATKSIAKGERILLSRSNRNQDESMSIDTSKLYKLTNNIAKEYAHELGDLMPYLQMAYSHIGKLDKSETMKDRRIYHTINGNYPNLQKIYSNPDIYTVANFLSQDECDRIIGKAQLNIQPCLVKNEETGVVEEDPSRTSTNANIPRYEVPSITKKILELGNCVEEQLELFQVLNYKRGQEFKPHTDGFVGATTACGFQDSGRVATVFCYLNDVQSGGTTLFTKLGLDIEPKRGMAVVHFPMSLDLVEDEMTEHQGSVAMDEKWILTTWIWKHLKADYRYSEENVAALSHDIV